MSSLPDLLSTLSRVSPPEGRVLSVYLDTSPGRVAGQAYLLAFRDGCKTLRATLPSAECVRFEAAAGQAERYLTEASVLGKPGLAIFASGRPDYFYAAPLPKRPIVGHRS